MSPRLAFAVEAAVRAGRSTLAHFQTDAAVEQKSDNSPVTIADRAAERIIREAIAKTYPRAAILGEEEGATGVGDDRWVVDPIDGTKSFIAGVPLYATLLAYEEAGRPTLGVCYFPALDELLYAEKGSGAYFNGRQARVSRKETVDQAILVCGGLSRLRERGMLQPLLDLASRAMALRTWCDAYGHALVATGRAEAMIDPVLSHWDISAMEIIVTEAGGRFTGFDGGEHPRAEAVSSNGLVHAALLEALGG